MQNIDIYYESLRQVYEQIINWPERKPPLYERIVDGVIGIIGVFVALSFIPIIPAALIAIGGQVGLSIGPINLKGATIGTFIIIWLVSFFGGLMSLFLILWVNSKVDSLAEKPAGPPQTLSPEQLTFIAIYESYKELKVFFVSHVEQCVKAKKNLVVGTTGWSKDLSQVHSLVKTGDIGLIYASNFSIGVNVFFQVMKVAGELFNNLEDYDVAVQEIHHKDKADSPSGTALTIADILMRRIKRKKEILNTPPSGKMKANQLQVTSTRTGAVVGAHTVVFDSPYDSLEFVHTAKNRVGFALGALLAAQWIEGKKGMFTMEDVLASNFQ
ncbi:MAG: 4-hydroxy-tetrahydrodipicolinate reductase [Bacteroidetes bacterium]|nr:4-hydroxy-tetrahydrodipicolinate reductase [Bacteroidota bacterium]